MISQQIIKKLQEKDPVIGELIDRYGACTLEPHHDHYMELLSSIVGQQLSVKAASTIWKRVIDLYKKVPSPQQLLDTDTEELRACGVSYSKISYMKDFANRLSDGSINLEELALKSNQEIITELTKVKGIGVWTTHMFLIFSLGRTDVLPSGDLGIKNAILRNYKLKSVPSIKDIESLAVNWHPYESIACWYLWKSLDNS